MRRTATADLRRPRDSPVLRAATRLSCSLVAVLLGCAEPPAPAVIHSVSSLVIVDSSTVVSNLAGVAGVVRTSKGAIVIAERGETALRVLQSDRPDIVLGRNGSGPGEFRLLHRLHLCDDDMLVAYDFVGRLQIFSDTTLTRSVQLPPQLAAADFIGCTAPDSLIFVKQPDRIPGLGVQMMPLTVFSFSLETGSVGWLAALRGTEMFISERYSTVYERPLWNSVSSSGRKCWCCCCGE